MEEQRNPNEGKRAEKGNGNRGPRIKSGSAKPNNRKNGEEANSTDSVLPSLSAESYGDQIQDGDAQETRKGKFVPGHEVAEQKGQALQDEKDSKERICQGFGKKQENHDGCKAGSHSQGELAENYPVPQ
jgi:hypothetical protein